MSSRAKKTSRNPHKISSTPKTQSETKLNQKKLKFGNKNDNGQSKNDTTVKNARENRLCRGKRPIHKDNTSKEKNRLFYSSEDEPDDNNVFEQNVSKSIQSFPRKNSDMPFKDRKFFKRNYPGTPSVSFSPETVPMEEENVTKVFKILSKSVNTPVITETKSIKKLPLKTYSTPKPIKTKVIESFGLPDNPIVSSLPTQYDDLDVGVTDAKEVTVFDVPFFEIEDVLPVKHYEKTFSSSLSNVDRPENTSPEKDTSPDHSVLIEKMRSQIRKLLSESPTHLKARNTSTPIKNVNSDKLDFDTSFMESNSLDIEIYNTSGKTDILFSPPRFSNKIQRTKVKKNKTVVSESVKFRQKLRSSESYNENEKTDNVQVSSNQNKVNKIERRTRSNSRSTSLGANTSRKSSPKGDHHNISSKRCVRSGKISKFSSKQSQNKSLELKIVLNPLGNNMLSNYSFDNNDHPYTTPKTVTCQTFLEHEKQNIFVPSDTTIINKILGDWDNSESDFEPIIKKNSRFFEKAPNTFLSKYEFNELSPGLLKEKLTNKNEYISPLALLPAQHDHAKEEVIKEFEQLDRNQKQTESNETKTEIYTSYVNQNHITKDEEKSFIEVEDGNLNFSVIQYEPLEEGSRASNKDGILIFETSSNLELITSKTNSLMNDGSINKNDNESRCLADNSVVNLNDITDEIETSSFSHDVISINQKFQQFNPTYDEMQHSVNSELENNINRNKGNITCDNGESDIVLNISNPEACFNISMEDTKHITHCVNEGNHQSNKKVLHSESYNCTMESDGSVWEEQQVHSDPANEVNSGLDLSNPIQENISPVDDKINNPQSNIHEELNPMYQNKNTEKNKNVENQVIKLHPEKNQNMDLENGLLLDENVGNIITITGNELTETSDPSESNGHNEIRISNNPTLKLVDSSIHKFLEPSDSDNDILVHSYKSNIKCFEKPTKHQQFLYEDKSLLDLSINHLSSDTKHNDEILSSNGESSEVILSKSEENVNKTTVSLDAISKEDFLDEDNRNVRKKHIKKMYTKCRTSMRLEKTNNALESINEMNKILDTPQISGKNTEHLTESSRFKQENVETVEESDRNNYIKRRTSMRLEKYFNAKEHERKNDEKTSKPKKKDEIMEQLTKTLVIPDCGEVIETNSKIIGKYDSTDKTSKLVPKKETVLPKEAIIHIEIPQKVKERDETVASKQKDMKHNTKSKNSAFENSGRSDIEELLVSPTKRKRGRPPKNNRSIESTEQILNTEKSTDIKAELLLEKSHTPNKLEMSLSVSQKSEHIVGPIENSKELRSEEKIIDDIDPESKQDLVNITTNNCDIMKKLELTSGSAQLRRRGRPLKVKRITHSNKTTGNENYKIIGNNSSSDKSKSEEEISNVSPKIFEGFEIAEQSKDAKTNINSLKSIHNIDLEQIEAELAAIECQKMEYALSKFMKLTRSKSRAALQDAKDEITKFQEKVKTLNRSRTSLGFMLKDSTQTTRRSSGRQRITMDIGELEALKEKRRRSQSVIPSVMRVVTQKKTMKDQKEKPPVFKLGTLAWARVGGHPYWPCLVTKEPESNIFKKEIIKIGFPKTVYHVRFFGDKGKRAWVLELKMMQYNNKDDVELLLQKAKKENKPFSERSAYIIRNLYLAKWQRAVNEAEELKGKTLAEKMDFFVQLDERRRLEKLERRIECPSISKRKRNESISTICSDISQITDFQDVSPARKRNRKEGEISSFRTEKQIEQLNSDKPSTSKLLTKEKEAAEDKSELVIPPYVPILDNENILPSRTRSGLHSDGSSDIVSKVSSEKSEKSDVSDPFSFDAQKSLFKRNNLFKGVSKERACQYCYQAGMVFKCTKGGCNGLYHLRCSVDVMSGEEYNKRKNKKKIPSQSTVVDHTPKEKELNTSSSTEMNDKNPIEDRVQIVTVTSHIYNTPPRKTFPDNFQAMTLAEQIDYKMKEVMKKFENETQYPESSADSSSEESTMAKMITKIKNSPSLRIDFDNLITDEKSVEDSTAKPNGKISDIIRKSRNSFVKHVTADSIIEISSVESSPSTTSRQNLIRHVTADSLTIETIDKNDKGKTNLKKNIKLESDLERTPSESSCSTISQISKDMFDPKNFKCGFCVSRLDPYCFICYKAISPKGSTIRQKCSLYQCGRYYHPVCLKLWPQTQWSLIQTTKHKTSKEEFDTFVCPQHVCHTCSSDDPRAATSRCSGDKIVKCLRCPSSYHSTNLCIPAGTDIISTTQVICPRHRDKNKATINTTWCFLCNEGGHLICCETCPTSVHPECMPVNLTDDDKFICEDCESGRLPLYDEIVWVKLGAFRWWPALILFPNEVPTNVMNARHSAGEFVVRFFGTYDHYWVSRSRSFLFQDGDAGQTTSTKKKVDEAFNRAVEEAVVAHKAKKEFKRTREVESLNSLKPPPYIRIKVNRPVGNVRHLDLDLSSTTSCDCDPNKPNPCEPDSDCLNRLLMTECNPEVCPAGQRCKNQSFEKREYPPMTPYKTEGRGWGLKTLAPIKKGQFVIEYVGELIDMEEYQRRILKMHEQKEENYYFLTIDKDRMIDAGPKGNMARFMNHCCQPNCETQKWTVNGDTRVGLFATVDIPAETELTFNYNLECVGKERKICRCGAPSCSGFIGVQKEKQDTEVKKIKKIYKKKKPVEQTILPPCFICQRKGTNVGLCNNKVCNKAYHLRCLNLLEWPEGNTFVCARHHCNICEKRTIRCCVNCVNSFCPSHSDGNIRYDNLLGFVCSSHDPTKPHIDNPVRVRARKSHVITEESAVTSTTSDDSEKEDSIPLSERLKTDKKDLDDIPLSDRSKKSKKLSTINTPDEEIDVNISNSTSSSDVVDENLVSSATSCGSKEGKRKKSARNDQTRKRLRLSKLVNNKKKSTARRNKNHNRQLDDR